MEDEMKGKDRKSGDKEGKEVAKEDKISEKPVKKKKENTIEARFLVSSSPHISDGQTTAGIMQLVIFALLPAALFSIYIFGIYSLRVIVISIFSALVFELLARWVMKRPGRECCTYRTFTSP